MRFLQPLKTNLAVLSKVKIDNKPLNDSYKSKSKEIEAEIKIEDYPTPNSLSLSYQEYLVIINACCGRNTDIYQDILKIPQDSRYSEIETSFFYYWLDTLLDLNDEILRKKDNTHILKLSRKLDAILASFRILSDPKKRIKYDEELAKSYHGKKSGKTKAFSLLDSESRDEEYDEIYQPLAIKKSRSCGSINSYDIATLFSTVHSTLSHDEDELNEEKHDVFLLNAVKSYYSMNNQRKEDDTDSVESVTNMDKIKKKVKVLVKEIHSESNIESIDEDDFDYPGKYTHEDGTSRSDTKSTESEGDELIKEYYIHAEELRLEKLKEDRRKEKEKREALRAGFMNLYKGKGKGYVGGIVKRSQVRKKELEKEREEAKKREIERIEEAKKLEERKKKIEARRLFIERNMPYLHDVDSLTNCFADLGESIVLCCTWFKDCMQNEASDLAHIAQNGCCSSDGCSERNTDSDHQHSEDGNQSETRYEEDKSYYERGNDSTRKGDSQRNTNSSDTEYSVMDSDNIYTESECSGKEIELGLDNEDEELKGLDWLEEKETKDAMNGYFAVEEECSSDKHKVKDDEVDIEEEHENSNNCSQQRSEETDQTHNEENINGNQMKDVIESKQEKKANPVNDMIKKAEGTEHDDSKSIEEFQNDEDDYLQYCPQDSYEENQNDEELLQSKMEKSFDDNYANQNQLDGPNGYVCLNQIIENEGLNSYENCVEQEVHESLK